MKTVVTGEEFDLRLSDVWLNGNRREFFYIPENEGYERAVFNILGRIGLNPNGLPPAGWDKPANAENEIFSVSPYRTEIVCDCGFTDRIARWREENKHDGHPGDKAIYSGRKGPHCICWHSMYLIAFHKPHQESLYTKGSGDVVFNAAKKAGWPHDNFSGPRGSSGLFEWCNCGLDELFLETFKNDRHEPSCAEAIPNFHHKPTDLKLFWHRERADEWGYVPRGGYVNRDVTLEEFQGICRSCIDSVKPGLVGV
jgi:hypothetical protein